MDKFPRDKQNTLLMVLYESFPYRLEQQKIDELIQLFGSYETLTHNLWYLHEHKLIQDPYRKIVGAEKIVFDLDNLLISKEGIDFIRDDGGLSSILNVTTIKIHNETLEKLENIIKKSDLTVEQKSSYLGKLKELPAETTKHLVLKLLDLGLSRSGDVLQLISSYFQS